MELKGKTVLITGSAKRIGREVALQLASRGAAILIHFNRSEAEARKTQKAIQSKGGKAELIQADFSTRPLVPLIQKTFKNYKIDVLINNASAFYPTQFGTIREDQWEDLHASNLKAPFFLAQEIGKRMKTGKIINMVDWTGFRPDRHFLPYCIAKAGLIAATQGLAKVLAPHVQVLGIAPGPILPPPGGMSADARKRAIDRTLLKRFGSPTDIAKTIQFLIEGTDFMTGAIIPVDGGALIA